MNSLLQTMTLLLRTVFKANGQYVGELPPGRTLGLTDERPARLETDSQDGEVANIEQTSPEDAENDDNHESSYQVALTSLDQQCLSQCLPGGSDAPRVIPQDIVLDQDVPDGDIDPDVCKSGQANEQSEGTVLHNGINKDPE